MERPLRLAILDMNKGVVNQGMRCIREIVARYSDKLTVAEFDVRITNELPDTSFDIYISSGGPGNPLEGNGIWEKKFFRLIDDLWQHNLRKGAVKKHMFFICHSFQLACYHFELGTITRRRKTAFGVQPVHKTKAGQQDWLLKNLPDPYFTLESRDFQLLQPKLKVFKEHGAKILSIERIRDDVDLERAIMAVRFSDEFVGTQFHPEAEPVSLKAYFQLEHNKEKIISKYSKRKFTMMMKSLDDPNKISLTYQTILPTFIENAISSIHKQKLKPVTE